MRIRATVAAVSGALALSALAVPAAQADGSADHRADIAKVREAARAASGNTPYTGSTGSDGEPYALDLTFSSVKVNSGKPIIVGTTHRVSVPVTYSVKHGASVDITADDFMMDVEIYRGAYGDESDNFLYGDNAPTCTATSSTAATCKGTIDVYPQDQLLNEDAGTWRAIGFAIALNGVDLGDEDADLSKVGFAEQDALATTKLQRYSRLTVNASPEPVKKGKTITVTGLLSRANWDTGKYAGYTVQPVGLQFRTKSASTYTSTLKTVKSDSTGNLKTTTTATVDGYFRYNFAGTSTTPAVKATGDYVDVQ
ncbi:hypothetical protein ABZ341_38165 [Streptomyces sp. NPDC006173]|uniref:hypothetical protein n=1 Tax=Streptomyces sp. NPDC006173 TaxID=3155349 RepID=UPI0033E8889F